MHLSTCPLLLTEHSAEMFPTRGQCEVNRMQIWSESPRMSDLAWLDTLALTCLQIQVSAPLVLSCLAEPDKEFLEVFSFSAEHPWKWALMACSLLGYLSSALRFWLTAQRLSQYYHSYLTAPHPELHSQAPQLSVMSFSLLQPIDVTQKLRSDTHQSEGEAVVKVFHDLWKGENDVLCSQKEVLLVLT